MVDPRDKDFTYWYYVEFVQVTLENYMQVLVRISQLILSSFWALSPHVPIADGLHAKKFLGAGQALGPVISLAGMNGQVRI